MKLFKQNLIWTRTVEEKHLGHIMVKLLFQKMGKKVKKIIIRSKLFSISIFFIEFSILFRSAETHSNEYLKCADMWLWYTEINFFQLK